jgi:hypothetical protein
MIAWQWIHFILFIANGKPIVIWTNYTTSDFTVQQSAWFWWAQLYILCYSP